MSDQDRARKLETLLHRAIDALHIAAAALRDRELPKLADGIAEQAITLTDSMPEQSA